jgi:hypothetical protein
MRSWIPSWFDFKELHRLLHMSFHNGLKYPLWEVTPFAEAVETYEYTDALIKTLSATQMRRDPRILKLELTKREALDKVIQHAYYIGIEPSNVNTIRTSNYESLHGYIGKGISLLALPKNPRKPFFYERSQKKATPLVMRFTQPVKVRKDEQLAVVRQDYLDMMEAAGFAVSLNFLPESLPQRANEPLTHVVLWKRGEDALERSWGDFIEEVDKHLLDMFWSISNSYRAKPSVSTYKFLLQLGNVIKAANPFNMTLKWDIDGQLQLILIPRSMITLQMPSSMLSSSTVTLAYNDMLVPGGKS